MYLVVVAYSAAQFWVMKDIGPRAHLMLVDAFHQPKCTHKGEERLGRVEYLTHFPHHESRDERHASQR